MKLSHLARTTAVLAAIGLTVTACGSNGDGGAADEGGAEGESYSIGISQYVSHPALDATAAGFKEAFETAGAEVTWDEQNSQADQGTMNNISGNFAQSDHDLIFAIATPSAISAATAITDRPIVFGAVTDPVDASLVADWEAPGGNVTGVSDMNPVHEQLELLQQIAPDAETVGIVYSSAESNSVVQVEAARDAAEELGLELVERAITNTNEVQQGVQALGDVDAIYVPTDNTVVSGLESVLSYGIDQQIPVISADTDSVERGAVATYGIDYHAQGVQAGEMALRILQGESEPADTPVETVPSEDLEVVVNQEAAEQMGITLPEDLLTDARDVADAEGEDEE
ncbi:ABC transporter substrate-binding protein [Citricoccus sp. NR2]|uniref:ABC transporter substrate-binding protein n=1 Tax=Citricoccus sp. NR2 TaxID=3004095 RepID=UPI0022DD5E68|nr:ABC transporter substrate-binding protein [Citricoccus sp. NR2]WBL19162.1 ABC transporter substrate-binding protein [Citricoccus sp. NR2]